MSLEKVSSFAPFLSIRVLAGMAFIKHVLPKFENIQRNSIFWISRSPHELALPIGLFEVAGGIALIFGIFTRITSILFIIEMALATLIVKPGNGFLREGGFEVDLLLMSIAISLLLSGP